MKKFFFAIAILCALGFLATFAVQSSYHGKAKLIQRIEKSASADLFGDAGTPIGEPAEYVIEDPKAFIGGPDDKGVYQVDEGYLKAHQIYPTQLKTIDFFTGAFRVGFGMAGVIAALIAWRMKPKSSN
ncbi:MAG: hypothetical protein JST12_04445 [Armatimonadetes bacterium]|nr:hypothetical protein [Armatimonadota bacterium]